MVRIRKGDTDMSIITGNTSFFSYFKGNAALEAVRLSSAFFGKGQFESQKMEKVGDTYILSASIKRPYYQPISKDELPTQDGDWNKMPRSMRIQSEVQTLDTKIYISEKNGKATIKVSMQGPTNLPVSLELCFRKGGTLNNINSKVGIPDAYLIKNGEYATYSKDGQTIKVGSGICSHKWTQLRGALPKLTGESLYFTNYAPCEFEFTIE